MNFVAGLLSSTRAVFAMAAAQKKLRSLISQILTIRPFNWNIGMHRPTHTCQ